MIKFLNISITSNDIQIEKKIPSTPQNRQYKVKKLGINITKEVVLFNYCYFDKTLTRGNLWKTALFGSHVLITAHHEGRQGRSLSRSRDRNPGGKLLTPACPQGYIPFLYIPGWTMRQHHPWWMGTSHTLPSINS